jgi:hypothetical protein
MSISKKNTTLFLYALFALLVTFMGDFVTAAPIGSIGDGSATIVCKFLLEENGVFFYETLN